MGTFARGLPAVGAGDGKQDEPSAEKGASRVRAALREQGAVLARVCMALLGDAEAAERALERVAREAAARPFDDSKDPRVVLLGYARVACATQLSKLPVRTGARASEAPETTRDHGRDSIVARAALGRLKPTEREAVVLHLVGGLDVAQVAEACGIDPAAARTRIARGVAQLVEEEKRR
jgi:RNA polymerase sigma-70 factor (ECF subfamily)